ncbi:MAG: ATP-binding cassette domain-containing protein [bacterium]
MPGAKPAVGLQLVTVSHRGRLALDRVSLAVEPHEFLGVIGPNGAGKTTLLTVINGFCPATAGRVTVLGRTLGRGGQPALRRRIGYVAQHTQADPRAPVSCREAVMLGRVGRIGLLRSPSRADRLVVEQMLDTVGIAGLAEQPVGLVSGGEARKVAIARALAQEPELLLLDEPTAGLDRLAKPGLLKLVEEAHHRFHLTTIMVTHHFEDLPACCRRVVILRAGRLLFDGDRESALTPGRLGTAYD